MCATSFVLHVEPLAGRLAASSPAGPRPGAVVSGNEPGPQWAGGVAAAEGAEAPVALPATTRLAISATAATRRAVEDIPVRIPVSVMSGSSTSPPRFLLLVSVFSSDAVTACDCPSTTVGAPGLDPQLS